MDNLRPPHPQRGCAHGEEPEQTYYHYHDAGRGFHIDYMFASRGFSPSAISLSVGAHADWARQSDHMPLLCEFHEQVPDRSAAGPTQEGGATGSWKPGAAARH